MTTRRPTASEMIWPDSPDDADLATTWAVGISSQVLSWMWRAFDSMRNSLFPRIDFTRDPEQLERDLTRNHFVEIQLLFGTETSGYASFVPVHEWPELETRSSSQAKPPAYDFAFIYPDDRRWAWPAEAKVVTSSSALGEYMKDVNEKFIRGVAAPLVGEGAMIAYLISCDADSVLSGIESRLGQRLQPVPKFVDRQHKCSSHGRENAPNIRLHHLMMVCDSTQTKNETF